MVSGGLTEWLGIPGTNADWLGVWGSVASLVSLLVSGYAAVMITVVRRKVSRQILFNVQAPKLVAEVAKVATWLTEKCGEGDVSDQDRLVEIRSCLARLTRHKTELPSDERKRVQDLEKLVQEFEKQPDSKSITRIVTEFRILGNILPDMVEAKHIGGSDEA